MFANVVVVQALISMKGLGTPREKSGELVLSRMGTGGGVRGSWVWVVCCERLAKGGELKQLTPILGYLKSRGSFHKQKYS